MQRCILNFYTQTYNYMPKYAYKLLHTYIDTHTHTKIVSHLLKHTHTQTFPNTCKFR